MRRTILATLILTGLAAAASAQTPAATLRLTVDEAVRLALQNNPDLKADRIDPQISDTRIAFATSAFKPSFNTSVQRNNQLQPPAGFLVPTPTRNDAITSNAGFSQRLPWFGTSYSASWNAVHTNSDSFLNAYNPLVQSGLLVNVSQPLLRNFFVDAPRHDLETSRVNRDIAETRLRESTVRTTAAVKTAYWNLIAARANVEARQKALELAQELVRANKARVDVGQSPPLDMVSAQAEAASNEEQLIIAQTIVKEAEDRLRLLILDTTQRDSWAVQIDAVDSPPIGLPAPDLDAAVATALRDRADLARARRVANSQSTVKYASNQRLPDVAWRRLSGHRLGGTGAPIGGFPGTIIGSGDVTNFGSSSISRSTRLPT